MTRGSLSPDLEKGQERQAARKWVKNNKRSTQQKTVENWQKIEEAR